jgi:hypothetical protein
MINYIKNISLDIFVKLSFFISLILILYSLFLSNHVTIKKQEKKLTTNNFIKLYIIRFSHYYSFVFLNLYPFLVYDAILYDIIYILLSIFITILYTFNRECILSIKEKQLLDPTYKIGDNIEYQPYMEVLLYSKCYKYVGIEFFMILILYMIFRTIYRIFKNK